MLNVVSCESLNLLMICSIALLFQYSAQFLIKNKKQIYLDYNFNVYKLLFNQPLSLARTLFAVFFISTIRSSSSCFTSNKTSNYFELINKKIKTCYI